MFELELAKNSLIGEGIAVEYSRDSPLAKQQLSAIAESFSGISTYVEGLSGALQDLRSAYKNIQV